MCRYQRNVHGPRILLEVFRGGQQVGEAIIEIRDWRGKDAYRVTEIEVTGPGPRSGAGTAMYEEALAAACEANALLLSSAHRSVFSEAFWRKQVKKGRARCRRPNPRAKWGANYYGSPLLERFDKISADCDELHPHFPARAHKCAEAGARALKRQLPKPRNAPKPGYSDMVSSEYWPCFIYAAKPTHCKDGSFKGLQGYL